MYVEYKGVRHPVEGDATREQVARTIAGLYPEELDNYHLIVKEDDPDGYILAPKFGKKG